MNSSLEWESTFRSLLKNLPKFMELLENSSKKSLNFCESFKKLNLKIAAQLNSKTRSIFKNSSQFPPL
jgi:hypothetical protein